MCVICTALTGLCLSHYYDAQQVFCQGCAVKGKRAAYNRWGMKAVMDMLRTHSSGQLLGIPGVLNL